MQSDLHRCLKREENLILVALAELYLALSNEEEKRVNRQYDMRGQKTWENKVCTCICRLLDICYAATGALAKTSYWMQGLMDDALAYATCETQRRT